MSSLRIVLLVSLAITLLAFGAAASEPGPAAVANAAGAAEQPQKKTFTKIDIDRIKLLYQVMDRYADSLWPGFDIRSIPIAVNCDDNQELLIGHPAPPDEFRPYEEYAIAGQTLCIRDGCTRYGPRSGGWAIDLGGERCAYVSTVEDPLTTDQFIPLLVHECFHVFQPGYREREGDNWAEMPELDADYSSLLSLEGRILHAALTDSTADVRKLASMFVAVREERRAAVSPDIAWTEGEEEFNEGTAEYVETRLRELLMRDSLFRHGLTIDDPRFLCFDSVGQQYRQTLYMIQPLHDRITTFMQAQYHQGMAQGFLLDRFDPDWKVAMADTGSTQFGLLQAALALDDSSKATLAAMAKAQFNFDSIAVEQHRLVDEQKAFLCGVVEKPGCRYRIYHSVYPVGFKWKPHGPVHTIPIDLMDEIDARTNVPTFGMNDTIRSNRGPIIWMGGLERFERGEMTLETKEVPVLYRHEYVEWIDPEPAADGSDCVIEGTTEDGVTYTDLKMTTDGFVLTVRKARVERADGVVAIIPEMTEAEPAE